MISNVNDVIIITCPVGNDRAGNLIFSVDIYPVPSCGARIIHSKNALFAGHDGVSFDKRGHITIKAMDERTAIGEMEKLVNSVIG